jgi:hypothetical protein
MPPADVAFIKAIIGIVVLGGFGLAFYWLRLRHRAPAAPELEREVAALNEDQAALRAVLESRLNDLEERLDFAERQLVQRSPLPRVAPPPARTPV